MAPPSSTLAWKISWTEEPGGLWPMRSLRVGHEWVTSLHFSLSCIGEGNGNPLQCSCLENPRDGGAWWAAIYGAAQNWTRLKWLSSSSSRVFLISVIVLFVSVCLFFNSSRSLLIESCIFSIRFSRFFDHRYYHYCEFFFKQFAPFLFIYLDFRVSSLFLHLYSISLPFHYFSKNIVFEVFHRWFVMAVS